MIFNLYAQINWEAITQVNIGSGLGNYLDYDSFDACPTSKACPESCPFKNCWNNNHCQLFDTGKSNTISEYRMCVQTNAPTFLFSRIFRIVRMPLWCKRNWIYARLDDANGTRFIWRFPMCDCWTINHDCDCFWQEAHTRKLLKQIIGLTASSSWHSIHIKNSSENNQLPLTSPINMSCEKLT